MIKITLTNLEAFEKLATILETIDDSNYFLSIENTNICNKCYPKIIQYLYKKQLIRPLEGEELENSFKCPKSHTIEQEKEALDFRMQCLKTLELERLRSSFADLFKLK